MPRSQKLWYNLYMNRKILAISVSIIFIIALGGYTAYWFMAAHKLKSELIAEIDRLHAPTYESVSTGGFPFRVEARLNKLHVESKDSSGGSVQIDCDQLAVSRSLFGSESKIGGLKTLSVSVPAQQGRQAIKVIANIPDGAWITWTQFENTSDIPRSQEEWIALLKNIETIEFKTGKTNLIDGISGKVLLEAEGSDLSIKLALPGNNRHTVEVAAFEKGFEYKPEFSAWAKSLIGRSPVFAVNGKHGFDAELTASWPVLGEGPVDVYLKRLDYKSTSYGTSHTELTMNMDTAQKSGSLKISGNWAGGAGFSDSIKKAMNDYVANQPKESASSVQIALMSGAAEVLSELFQPEGKVSFDASVALAGPNAPSVTLRAAEYKSGPYDISIQGELKATDPKKSSIHASLSNFKPLLDKFTSKVSEPDLKDKLHELFDSIAPESRGSNNLEITYSMDTGKIGTLTPQEFLDKCKSLMGSVN